MVAELLAETGWSIVSPLISLWTSFLDVFPKIVVALVIILIGYFVAVLLGHIVRVVLEKVKLDTFAKKAGMPKSLEKLKFASILGLITKWFVLLIFLQAGVEQLSLGGLSELLNQFVMWLPHLIFGVLAVFLGLFVAHYVSDLVKEHSDMKWSKFAAGVIKITIVFLGIVIGLQQIGIEVQILEGAFLIILGAAAFGVALALGLSFGLGLKGRAPQMWDDLKKKF